MLASGGEGITVNGFSRGRAALTEDRKVTISTVSNGVDDLGLEKTEGHVGPIDGEFHDELAADLEIIR